MERGSYSDVFKRVREAVWLADPLGVAGERVYASDEYDDVAWRVLSAIGASCSDEEVQQVWVDQLVALGVLPTPDSAPNILRLLEDVSRSSS